MVLEFLLQLMIGTIYLFLGASPGYVTTDMIDISSAQHGHPLYIIKN